MVSTTNTTGVPLLDHVDHTVADILARRPQARKVFAQHDIDYCCEGHKTLAEVCWDTGVELAPLLSELDTLDATPESATGSTPVTQPRWDQMSVQNLVDHIVVHCHRPLQTELPLICVRARMLLDAEGDKAPALLQGIVNALEALLRELVPHMHDEEARLFPWLKQHARHPEAGLPLLPNHMNVLMDEHEHVVGLLRQLRLLTGDYSVPVGRRENWALLWQSLADLDADLQEHIHLENNVLFPRVRRNGAA